MRRSPPLGTRALELLEHASWSGKTCSREDLTRALTQAGLRAESAWLDFEQQFGGLEIVESTGARTIYGCHVALAQRARSTVTEQAGRIACSSGNLTRLLTLASDDSIWSRQLDGSAPPSCIAETSSTHIERALRDADRSLFLEVQLRGEVGSAIARRLDLTHCSEASDAFATLWECGHTVVIERLGESPVTRLTTSQPEAMQTALAGLPSSLERRHGPFDSWSRG